MSFRKIEIDKKYKLPKCNSPEHNPPMHIVLKPGVWEWTCPKCGATQTIVVPKITC